MPDNMETILLIAVTALVASFVTVINMNNRRKLKEVRYPLHAIRFIGKRELWLSQEVVTAWSFFWITLVITRNWHSTLLLD